MLCGVLLTPTSVLHDNLYEITSCMHATCLSVTTFLYPLQVQEGMLQLGVCSICLWTQFFHAFILIKKLEDIYLEFYTFIILFFETLSLFFQTEKVYQYIFKIQEEIYGKNCNNILFQTELQFFKLVFFFLVFLKRRWARGMSLGII